MPVSIKLWTIVAQGNLAEVPQHPLDLESRLENWIEQDVAIIAEDLLLIGKQIKTDYGGVIDLLGIDSDGNLVIIELKRDQTPREVTAQALDYASWIKDLSNDKVTDIASSYLQNRYADLETAFQMKFGTELPEVLNERHRILIVASEIDASSERIIRYLSDTYGVSINAVTFHYFRDTDGRAYLSRAFLIEPSQVEYQSRAKASGISKRKPNLTHQELCDIAYQNGVGELCDHLVKALTAFFDRLKTTRSSLAFKGSVAGAKRATIFSLIPVESDPERGLRFQVYASRLAEFLNVPVTTATELLPAEREPWQYYPNAPEDMSGYAGFFRTLEAADLFLARLTAVKSIGRDEN